MPTMPEWAEGGRIVWDKEFQLAFIRRGLRRSHWTAYALSEAGLTTMNLGGYPSLERARKAAIKLIGDGLEQFVLGLHPGALYAHMRHKTGTGRHACFAPYSFRTAEVATNVTCPLCLAILAEDLKGKIKGIGEINFAQKRELVRETRAANAFGKLVTGDNVTDDL